MKKSHAVKKKTPITPKPQKHVAFIGQKGYPPEFPGTSGIEFYVYKKVQQLKKRSIQSTVYIRSWSVIRPVKQVGYLCVVRLPSINTKHLDTLTHALMCSLHVCFSGVDTVWYQAMGPSVWAWIPKLSGKKIRITIHGLDWKRKKWGLLAQGFLKISEKAAVWFSDELVVVSREQQNYFIDTYNKNSVIDEPKTQRKKPFAPDIITKKYGLKGGDYILYMGRFVPEKRIDWLIRAYKELKLKGIKLVLAGGSSHSDDYVKKLHTLAFNNQTIKQSGNILFLGWVFEKEKEELLSNCRLFVLPSDVEGSPIVLSEALKYQKTCLVSKNLNIRRNRCVLSFSNDYGVFKKALLKAI